MAIGRLASASVAAVEAGAGEGELDVAALGVAALAPVELGVAALEVAALGVGALEGATFAAAEPSVPGMGPDGVVVAGVVTALVCPGSFAGPLIRGAVAPAPPDAAARTSVGACLAAVAPSGAGELAAPAVAGWTGGAEGEMTARLAAAATSAFAEAVSVVAGTVLALADESFFAPLALDELGIAGLALAVGALLWLGARVGGPVICAVSD